ncbi:hypothetical protein R3W88_019241 [Solanum pinnatisectum]|uniref:DUF4283 domain-containing protein n=1 Tax=Solanum pinnatisectum TaxID=50273 RepID=A0AAV9KJ45_9SOLN|nr:hypothetical protein R3W88_019241 [Solanum pinnatisectum]
MARGRGKKITILTGDKAKVQIMSAQDLVGKEQWPALLGSKTPILGTTTPYQIPVIGTGTTTSEKPGGENAPITQRAKTPVGMESSEKPKWANLFQGNRLVSQQMTLKYIAPLVPNGETVVELSKTKVELEIQRWTHALILYVVGADPTIAALERYIATNWNYITKTKVYYHNDRYFLVKLTKLEDRDEVLYAGPHMLNSKPIIVKTWSPEFDFNKEVMQTIPIWVKFPNLPLNCWDECTTQVDRISYARLLIDMDITKTLPTELKVEDLNGRIFT